MARRDPATPSDPTIIGNDRPRREPDGDAYGAEREGRYARQPGYGRRAHDNVDEETESSIKRSGPQPGGQKFSKDDDVPTHGPEDKHGEDRNTI